MKFGTNTVRPRKWAPRLTLVADLENGAWSKGLYCMKVRPHKFRDFLFDLVLLAAIPLREEGGQFFSKKTVWISPSRRKYVVSNGLRLVKQDVFRNFYDSSTYWRQTLYQVSSAFWLATITNCNIIKQLMTGKKCRVRKCFECIKTHRSKTFRTDCGLQ